MGDYNRSTRACAFDELRPELAGAIRAYLERHELAGVEREALMCCETRSEKKQQGFWARLKGGDPDAVHHVGALLTPAWLIWARSGERSGTVVAAARLREVEVKDYASSLIPDAGLDVSGFLHGATERGSAFIGLGEEAAAQLFREAVKLAVAEANG